MNEDKYILTEDEELQVGKTADFSFKKFTELKPIGIEGARLSRIGHLPTKSNSQKFLTRALWLNNNKLTNVKNIEALVESVLEYPEQLAWLDFSYNHISEINEDILKFPNLKIIYFHGNRISDLDQIVKLREFRDLRSLTLHGNPIADMPNYRAFVITMLPQVINLDFAPIIKSERKMPAPPEAIRKLGMMYRTYSEVTEPSTAKLAQPPVSQVEPIPPPEDKKEEAKPEKSEEAKTEKSEIKVECSTNKV